LTFQLVDSISDPNGSTATVGGGHGKPGALLLFTETF
jgi:hypothetical protein